MRPRDLLHTTLLLAAAGCARPVRAPDLGALYSAAAAAHDSDRNPVIVVPGILGSRLETRDGRVVWGAFTGEYADPGDPAGARLLALPMQTGAPLSELVDEVVPAGALESVEVRVLGLPVVERAYAYVLATLGAGGYRDESLGLSGAVDYGDDHFTCFQFDYDWRRDLSETARRFDEFVRAKKAYVEAELRRRYGIERDVRFDIVAHSMGGLLVRYWLRYGTLDADRAAALDAVPWTGAELVDRAVLVAPPNAGSVSAFEEALDGVHLSVFLPDYRPALLGTMPSVYELLPRTRAGQVTRDGRPVRVLDPEEWERNGWGLLDPREDDVLAMLLPSAGGPDERRAIARDHLRKCLERARAFQQALDRPSSPPPGTELVLFAGDALATPSALALDSASGRPLVRARAPGDGTVTRQSALGDERRPGDVTTGVRSPVSWAQVTFLFTDHLGLTRDPAFADNVLFLLLEARRQPR